MSLKGELREIVLYPDARLSTKSAVVTQITDIERKEFDDLDLACHHYGGIGLAGVQIGIMKQMFVIDHDRMIQLGRYEGKELGHMLFMANTQILEKSNETTVLNEKCLSLPSISVDVERPKNIKISYLDYDGKYQELDAGELLAKCILHELDHTLGKLIIDYQ